MDLEDVHQILAFTLSVGLFTMITSIIGLVSSNLKEERVQVVLNVIYSILIISGSTIGLAVIISSVIQVNDMSQTSLNSLAKRYWIVFYAFSKDKIKHYQGSDSEIELKRRSELYCQ